MNQVQMPNCNGLLFFFISFLAKIDFVTLTIALSHKLYISPKEGRSTLVVDNVTNIKYHDLYSSACMYLHVCETCMQVFSTSTPFENHLAINRHPHHHHYHHLQHHHHQLFHQEGNKKIIATVKTNKTKEKIRGSLKPIFNH